MRASLALASQSAMTAESVWRSMCSTQRAMATPCQSLARSSTRVLSTRQRTTGPVTAARMASSAVASTERSGELPRERRWLRRHLDPALPRDLSDPALGDRPPLRPAAASPSRGVSPSPSGSPASRKDTSGTKPAFRMSIRCPSRANIHPGSDPMSAAAPSPAPLVAVEEAASSPNPASPSLSMERAPRRAPASNPPPALLLPSPSYMPPPRDE
mmetsp:Transcript_20453/g.78594  ORF Transcript_20453/g.78594 Transcript_20453/m.78594 type:complete len:214 (+) Transcript_20453:3110-3751(+)